MTTGYGRRCQFCLPDLNLQIDFPKEKIMAAIQANARDGNNQISLATEDMFILAPGMLDSLVRRFISAASIRPATAPSRSRFCSEPRASASGISIRWRTSEMTYLV